MGAESIAIGAVQVLSLADAEGPLHLPPEQIVPGISAELQEPYRRRYPEAFAEGGLWSAPIGSFLLRSAGRTLLVDTGIGPYPFALMGGVRGRLPDELYTRGIDLAAIDTVFLTHAHGDHIGWNVLENGSAAFPNARYLIHRADWDWAHHSERMAGNASAARSLTPLEKLGRLELLDGEKRLTDEVTAIHTPGHTPGHMSVIIASDGEKALITGDVLSNPAQVSEPDWVSIFDADGAEAAATRRALLERIEAEGMTMVAGHFPRPGFGRVVRLEGRRYWQAL